MSPPPLSQIATEENRSGDRTSQGEGVGAERQRDDREQADGVQHSRSGDRREVARERGPVVGRVHGNRGSDAGQPRELFGAHAEIDARREQEPCVEAPRRVPE